MLIPAIVDNNLNSKNPGIYAAATNVVQALSQHVGKKSYLAFRLFWFTFVLSHSTHFLKCQNPSYSVLSLNVVINFLKICSVAVLIIFSD